MFYEERTDGLLRGSRDERIEQMRALKEEDWTLATILALHCGLLDHGFQVREAAMDSLLEIAKRKPDVAGITPAQMLTYFMHAFTVASGIPVAVVQCLAQLQTKEAGEMLTELLESGGGSNELFNRWVSVLSREWPNVLSRVSMDRLSPKRKTVLRQALQASNSST